MDGGPLLVDQWVASIATFQFDPMPGHSLVSDHAMLPIARSILEHAHDSHISSLAGFLDIASRLRTATAWSDALRHGLAELMGPLDMCLRGGPPHPTQSDRYILGVLQLMTGAHALALESLNVAGRIVRSGTGLVSRASRFAALTGQL